MKKLSVTFNLDQTFIKNTGLKPNDARRLQSQGKNRNSLPFNPLATTIYLWVKVLSITIKVNTGYAIKPVYWDSVNKRASKNSPGHIELNKALRDIEDKVYEDLLKRQSALNYLLKEDIKSIVTDIVKGKYEDVISTDFFNILDLYLKEKEPQVKIGTLKKLRDFKSIMLKFQESEKCNLHLLKIN